MPDKWRETRETLKIFIPLAVLLSLGVFTFLYIDREARLSSVETREAFLVKMARIHMNRDLEVLSSDISILRQSDAMNALSKTNSSYSQAILANNFLKFAEYRQIYDQIRLIDKDGQELVRVDYDSDKAKIVPERKLQNKSKRYYFSKIMALERGENFISPLDLNVENGKIERPLKPIIRIGTPIFDRMGDKQGILVLNYLGSRLIKSFDEATATSLGHAYLVNRDGYWLRGPKRKDEWGFIFGNDRSFRKSNPKAWEYMKNTASGKFYDDNGLFVFATFPLGNRDDHVPLTTTNVDKSSPLLKIVTYTPAERYSFASLKRFKLSLAFFGGILIFLALGSWKIGTARLSKKLSDGALYKSERRFSTAFNSSPNMISITDIKDGRLLNVNEIWLSTLGYKREEVIGKTVFELDLWINYQQRSELVDKINREGRIHNFEGKLKAKDGKVRDFMFSGGKIELDEGTVALLTITDITERKQAEAALRSAKDNADLSNRAKTEFMANVSHELRTPLNAIIGFSEIMTTETLSPIGIDKYREYANDIRGAGAHLLKLINDILDVSRIEADSLPLFEDTVDVKQVITSCQRLVQGRAESAGLELRIEIPDTLPAMLADERRLKQVFINLLSNAIKFTPKGGTVTIRVSVDDDGGFLIVITDTGIGIEPENMKMVFNTFGQADSSLSRQHEGVGLGLPLSNGLVKLHGGKLTMESTPGAGTTIKISFPRQRTLMTASSPR